jgi:hypothetical protein
VAVMNSAASSVTVLASVQPVGSTASTVEAIDCAAEVTMNETLKPTPVSVTTPITIPTVAAAAPTASAYLAPVTKASRKASPSMRPRTPSARASSGVATTVLAILPDGWVSVKSLTLVAALFMTALVCVLMGCGIPTTANYLIMVTVAAPTLGLLGVAPLVAHFFVFYYGVLADITPPVALAAYAAAGMAGSDPFKTGNTAFRLGLGKALVPFVFVFAPSLLLVVPGFTWTEFALAFTGCVLGITFLAAALSKYLLVRMHAWERIVCTVAALLMVAPELTSTIVGIVMVIPVLVRQVAGLRQSHPHGKAAAG